MKGHATTTDVLMRKRGYLLASEAARKIGKSVGTIYNWLATAKVKGVRDGYRQYVKWKDILTYIGPQACELRGLSEKDIWTESGL